jgi:hypothetical protein
LASFGAIDFFVSLCVMWHFDAHVLPVGTLKPALLHSQKVRSMWAPPAPPIMGVTMSWHVPHIAALSRLSRSWSVEYADLWKRFGIGSLSSPRMTRSVASFTSPLLWAGSTDSMLWQK